MRFGAHVSISGGVSHAPANGVAAGCDVVQIFTKNQMQWKVRELPAAEIARFAAEQERTGVQVVCVHASYLINLGGPDAGKLERSRSNFIVEMTRADVLGIPYLVVHPGSHMGEGESIGLTRIAESLDYVFERTEDQKVKVLLESTAGQGDNLGYTFEQLATIKAKVKNRDRVGFCIDTCHIFAAGYELRTDSGYRATMTELDEMLGADQVGVIHCNDSQRELGRRRDRHAHIGEGHIGIEGFRRLVNDDRFRKASFVLETPGGPEKDIENLEVLRGLVVSQREAL